LVFSSLSSDLMTAALWLTGEISPLMQGYSSLVRRLAGGYDTVIDNEAAGGMVKQPPKETPMHMLYVRDLMRSPVITVQPQTRLPTIKLMMCQHGVHRLPVVDGTGLTGIVTLGDVRNAFPSDLPMFHNQRLAPLDQVRALDLMRTDVITIAPDVLVAQAAQVMLRHKISGLPVLHGNRLVGIITKSDLCRAMAEGDIVLAPHDGAAAGH
jgi:CBS domain-containing protein